jgi:hypothetical protein
LPSLGSRTTRATTSSGVDLGLPSVTPFSFLTCSASRVRVPMKSCPLGACLGPQPFVRSPRVQPTDVDQFHRKLTALTCTRPDVVDGAVAIVTGHRDIRISG